MIESRSVCVCITRLAGIPGFDEQAYARRMIDEDAIRYRWDTVGGKLDEAGGGCLRRPRCEPLGGAV